MAASYLSHRASIACAWRRHRRRITSVITHILKHTRVRRSSRTTITTAVSSSSSVASTESSSCPRWTHSRQLEVWVPRKQYILPPLLVSSIRAWSRPWSKIVEFASVARLPVRVHRPLRHRCEMACFGIYRRPRAWVEIIVRSGAWDVDLAATRFW